MKQSTRDFTAYLDSISFRYAVRADDEDLVMLSYTTEQSTYGLLAMGDTHSLQIVCRLPFVAPAERRAAVMEYFTRANYHLKSGCFELDLSDGEMNLRVATFLTDEALCSTQGEMLVRCIGRTADNYLPGLQAVLFRDAEPAQAIAAAEAAFAPGAPQGVSLC